MRVFISRTAAGNSLLYNALAQHVGRYMGANFLEHIQASENHNSVLKNNETQAGHSNIR